MSSQGRRQNPTTLIVEFRQSSMSEPFPFLFLYQMLKLLGWQSNDHNINSGWPRCFLRKLIKLKNGVLKVA